MGNRFVSIYIGGEPVAQGRPRFTSLNGMPRAIDPKRSRDYKSLLRLEASRVMRENNLLPTDKPLSVWIKVTKTPPKSWSKKKLKQLEEGWGFPITSKPDLDNYIKVLDGLNGIVWKDDNQVWEIRASKQYSVSSGMEIEVYEEEFI